MSLFDGISCGYEALNRAGIKVNAYYASEINATSIAISKYNHPDIIQIGDARDIDISKLPQIDILIGGSPCQNFSFSGTGKGAVTIEGIEVTTLEQYLELKGLERLGDNSESFDNKIALCKDCHSTKDYHTTKEDYLKLIKNPNLSKKN